MSSDLLSIAASGVKAARIALDVTAQNIANASSEGYVRRSVRLAELAPPATRGQVGDTSFSGVRLDRVVRNADLFRLAEMRRTAGDAARANTEVAGLENIESSIENAQIFPGLVDFEATLERLTSDPTDMSLRASVLESGATLARGFNVASGSLDAVTQGLHFDADAEVEEVNLYAQELARINLRLARAQNGSADQSALLDQRDMMLQRMGELADITTTYASDQTVRVDIGSGATGSLVSGGTVTAFTMAKATDGTLSFALGAEAVTLAGGKLAGEALSLVHLDDFRDRLDALAASFINTVNTAQTGGADLNGSAGQVMFTGSSAATMAMVLTHPNQIATAAAGSSAGSRDQTNLTALRTAMETADPVGAMNALIFDVSGMVSGRSITRDALDSIASSARIALETQAGVDLDHEAINLVRYQQAFQASGKAMQVASDIFDTILGIG